MRILCILLVLLLCPGPSDAQKENNVWVYGDGSGLDFNSGSPVMITSSISTSEAATSVCNTAGRLLFYTNNELVWDSTHKLMPNNGLTGGTSSTHGVVIVPVGNRPGQYYLFSVDEMEKAEYGLHYSLIDMSLNGGKGDIVSGVKNIKLGTLMSEKIVVAPTCNGIWVITHRVDSPAFYAYLVNAAGLIAPPVISKTNSAAGKKVYAFGGIKLSNDYSKIVCTDTMGWQMFSFDSKSGKVAYEPLLSERNGWGWNFEFSPDDSKLYSSGQPVTQYDLSLLPDESAVLATKYLIGAGRVYYHALRKGPDGKIYFAETKKLSSISCINKPDSTGAACNAVLNIPILKHSNTIFFLNFGNNVVPMTPVQYHSESLTLCENETIILKGSPGYDAYKWNDGDTAIQKEIKHSGYYWLESYRGSCPVRVDTFKTRTVRFDTHLNDTIVCNGGQLKVDATIDAIDANYRWQDGSVKSSYLIDKTGVYWVDISVGRCIKSDTMQVTYRNLSFDLGADQQVCKGLTYLIQPQIKDADFLWNDGSTGAILSVTKTGTYSLTASSDGCTKKDTIKITVVPCSDCIAIPNAFTPDHDGLNDMFQPIISCPVLKYSLIIVNRFGQEVFRTTQANQGWDGTFKGLDEGLGTYYYLLEVLFDYPDAFESIHQGDVTLIR